MNKSKSENIEIEEVPESKSDKSEISFDQEIVDQIKKLIEEGESKDDISFEMIVSHQMKPSLFEKYWKPLNVSKCYRRKTTEMFFESDGLVSKKEWSDEMVRGGYLKNTTNYLQHFATFYSLYHHKEFNPKV